jgi:hypothetical protein
MGNEESRPTAVPVSVPQVYLNQQPQQYNAPQGWQQYPQYQQQNTFIRQQTPIYPPQQPFQPQNTFIQPQNTFIRQQTPQYPPSNGNPGQRVPSARLSSAKDRQLYPNLAIPSTNNFKAGFKLDDQTLNRFLEIQSLIDAFEKKGVFDGLRIAEEEYEAMEKSKRQAEINHKVLTEQTKKEKQDFENISQPTVQAYFKNQQAHKQAISKEEVSLNFSKLLLDVFLDKRTEQF